MYKNGDIRICHLLFFNDKILISTDIYYLCRVLINIIVNLPKAMNMYVSVGKVKSGSIRGNIFHI